MPVRLRSASRGTLKELLLKKRYNSDYLNGVELRENGDAALSVG
jgi:hypothetical protein